MINLELKEFLEFELEDLKELLEELLEEGQDNKLLRDKIKRIEEELKEIEKYEEY